MLFAVVAAALVFSSAPAASAQAAQASAVKVDQAARALFDRTGRDVSLTERFGCRDALLIGLFGAMLAELYPTALRGAGQGFVYNIGRGLSSVAPWTVGFFADRYGIGAALALNSAFFVLGAALIFTLPETKQVELE